MNRKGYPLDRYDLDTYMLPYWDGGIVYQESVMVLCEPDGTVGDISLLYKAEQILSVRSSDLKWEFQAGKDYELADGKLRILKDSQIPTVCWDFYYPPQENRTCKRLNEKYGDGYIFFSEGGLMHSLQLAVTYTHRDTFDGPVPACKRQLLPKTDSRLSRGEALKLCVFGDSICVGGNSTGWMSVAPMAKNWCGMLADRLAETYPDSTVLLHNPSVGGMRSEWGVEVAAEKVGYGPDLCIIGFGMNDGSKRIPPEVYQQNIKTIMQAVAEGNPDCEFVLIATALPNPQVGRFFGYQEEYLPMLQQLEKVGVAVADMTTFHRYLLTRKRFFDMSGNNVNHPNDFLARAYAQVLWQTIHGYEG